MRRWSSAGVPSCGKAAARWHRGQALPGAAAGCRQAVAWRAGGAHPPVKPQHAQRVLRVLEAVQPLARLSLQFPHRSLQQHTRTYAGSLEGKPSDELAGTRRGGAAPPAGAVPRSNLRHRPGAGLKGTAPRPPPHAGHALPRHLTRRSVRPLRSLARAPGATPRLYRYSKHQRTISSSSPVSYIKPAMPTRAE